MTRILVVEDEPAMLSGLSDNLEFESYDVDTADKGDIAWEKISNGQYHLILLDVMLPNLSGFDILKKMRSKNIRTPVILLTAKGEELDKVRGLELGADDYITKPFSLRELLARVKAILRRTEINKASEEPDSDVVQIGCLTVCFDKLEAFDNDKAVKMTHKEFEILQYLYQHRNTIVTRDQLLDKVWGFDYQPSSRTIDNFILRLRNKVDSEQTNHIVTVHGMGYKLVL
ncbi:MAG: response regulator transcription factor [Prolixibacteraceae bacterium]|nr:response regulator transcription factor [Prolixibacteraceae bacterium]MBN2650294.1 response regulator transcription factor [Prolixibacteraceae bacterium]